MMLHLLSKYAADHGLVTEPGFAPKRVRWVVVCDSEGRFLQVMEIGDTENKKNPGREFGRCPDLAQNELVSKGGPKSHFLADTAQVVTLLGVEEGDSKLGVKHASFLGLLEAAGAVMPDLAKLAGMLRDASTLEEIRTALAARKAKPTERVTFQVAGSYPLESDAWHDWWRSFRKSFSVEGDAETPGKGGKKKTKDGPALMRCLITGELAPPARINPKIEGLADVGGQPAGTTLVGFDKDAFCSYGLSQSANAALTEEAAASYRAALNHLIRHQSHRVRAARIVYWFKRAVPREDDPMAWLMEGGDDERGALRQARKLLDGPRTGERPPGRLDNHYYAMTLSGAGGRVMMRDWMEGDFDEMARSVARWFEDLSIVHRDGDGLAPDPKFLAVAGSTVRDLDDLTGPFAAVLWRAALQGGEIPRSALAMAVNRAVIGFVKNDVVNHARMGLIKACLIRKQRIEGGEFMARDLGEILNEEHPHPAYHCGRLMALMAQVQKAALGDVGAGVVQRYYAAASTTPALVLGRLVRTSQFHLAKITSAALARWYENRMARVWAKIRDEVPKTLTLEEQSLFALGYYQQLATKTDKKSIENDPAKEDVHE